MLPSSGPNKDAVGGSPIVMELDPVGLSWNRSHPMPSACLLFAKKWMNEFLKKEHTGHPRTCRNEESTPRVQHSARAALMLVHCQRNAESGLVLG